MTIINSLKKIFKIFLETIIIGSLCSCFDLGIYEIPEGADQSDVENYYSDYYNTFGDVYLYDQKNKSDSYKLKDSFFNKETVNNLRWTNKGDEVDFDSYVYLAIQAQRDINIDCVALYYKAESSTPGTFQVCAYIMSSTPSDIPAYNDQIYELDKVGQPILDIKGNKVYKDYDLKDKSQSKAIDTGVIGSSWESVNLDLSDKGEDFCHVNSGEYLILCFYNNTGYGKAIGLNQYVFTATNLLIRIV